MNHKRVRLLLLISTMVCATTGHAQVFSNKEVGKKNEALVDSLKRTAWPYVLPIWGEKATKRGYTLPLPAGISLQYFGQESDLIINNLQVGFNNNPMQNLDGIIRFDKAVARSDGVSIRPDIWLYPFLNIYGIFGQSAASTNVGYSLWLPDSSGVDQQVFSLETKVDFQATTIGFGLTPTLGVGGGWMALDMNFTWTDVPQLAQPASVFVFDPRVGKMFKLRNPDESISLWAGGWRVALNTGTSGSIPLSDALPTGDWQASVDQGKARVDQLNQENETWWASLSPPQQANPVNKAKYEATKAALARAGAFLESAGHTVNTIGSSTVQYSLDKRPADMWNLAVGGQYQLNKQWMFRGEVGFRGSRTHILAGAQYRFGL